MVFGECLEADNRVPTWRAVIAALQSAQASAPRLTSPAKPDHLIEVFRTNRIPGFPRIFDSRRSQSENFPGHSEPWTLKRTA
jgi:hypothetical protein